MLHLACIVEGHGESQAVPILVRRIATEIDPAWSVQIPMPLRVPRHRLVKEGELERAVILAGRKVGVAGAILVLIDADSDCPAQLGPALLARARAARGDLPIAVVLAKREYESWFLASAESLRGRRGLPLDLVSPAEPEALRGAKEWLRDRMPAGTKYREVLDQPALTALFDMTTARRAPSFAKCPRDVVRLLTAIAPPGESRDFNP
jgi:hypothetical protein